MYDVLIHLGLQKTASTWLQVCLFGGPHTDIVVMPYREIMNSFISPNPFTFDQHQCVEKIRPYLLEAKSRGTFAVLSNEHLSGDPYSGGFDTLVIAERIKTVLPDAKLLLIIREQKSMILSLHSQFIKKQGSFSLNEFLKQPQGCTNRPFDPAFLKYHKQIKFYYRMFRKDNVLVLPMERLKVDTPGFISDILDFMGSRNVDVDQIAHAIEIRTNVALSPIEIILKRYLNPFVMHGRMNMGSVLKFRGSSRISNLILKGANALVPKSLNDLIAIKRQTHVAKYVGTTFKRSNRLTAELIDHDLQLYGYDM